MPGAATNSSGGKDRAGKDRRISKQGDPYPRRLLVVGAHAVLRFSRSIEIARLLPPRFCFDARDEQLVVNKAVEEVVPFLGLL